MTKLEQLELRIEILELQQEINEIYASDSSGFGLNARELDKVDILNKELYAKREKLIGR